MSDYSESELHEKFRRRIDEIDDTMQRIEALGVYARMNAQNYRVFIAEIEEAFSEAATNIPKQRALIYLVNEIIQNENSEVLPLFKPALERIMIKAAETRDDQHIQRAKYVLDVLLERKFLDSYFVHRVTELMDARRDTGGDEETAIADRFLLLVDRVVRAKQAKLQAMEKDGGEEVVAERVAAELAARRELMDMCTQQLNQQMQKINAIEKRAKRQGKKTDDIFDNLEEEEDEDENSATVM